MLLLNECLLLLLISLSTQSGYFWKHPRMYIKDYTNQQNTVVVLKIKLDYNTANKLSY